MRSRAWVVIDCRMLLSVVVLQAWRLTGVPLHEWLGVALSAAILAHLLLHWTWVESRSRQILASGNARTRVNYALNLLLFLSMTAAIVSGFMISKVVLPLHPSPDDYLKWHSIHETSSRVTLACVALHLALNWDLLFARRPRFQLIVARVAVIVAAVVVTAGVVVAVDRAMPRPDITFIGPDGRRTEHAAPPPDIARLRRDDAAPSARGIPEFVVQSIAVAGVAIIGRKVLRLRLDV